MNKTCVRLMETFLFSGIFFLNSFLDAKICERINFVVRFYIDTRSNT